MRVTRVAPGSDAERAGIRSGDELLVVSGEKLEDPLDLTFALAWTDETKVAFELSRDGSPFSVTLPVAGPEELGLEVQGPPVKTCGNRCVFCFVDQLPRGLRASLYVKDEDYRLSFSYGNYITLTNLSRSDYERIAAQHLSPLYVSVHATDDTVRRKMLGNEDAPPILESLRRLDRATIEVHAQAVLCPGINDGAVLEQTLSDLFVLGELIQSVAVVPVGLTAHRERLTHIDAVTSAAAKDTLDTIEHWQRRFVAAGRDRTVYAADELYLRAGRTLPPYEQYGDLPQLENGVGLLRSFEFDLNESAGLLGDRLDPPIALTLVTARLAEMFLADAIDAALGRVDGFTCHVVASDNSLLGPAITVAGLLSGKDMIGALKRAPKSDAYLLPAAAFNADGVTIDDMSVDEIADGAGRESVEATDDIVESVLNIIGAAVRGTATTDRAASSDATRGRETRGRKPSEEGR